MIHTPSPKQRSGILNRHRVSENISKVFLIQSLVNILGESSCNSDSNHSFLVHKIKTLSFRCYEYNRKHISTISNPDHCNITWCNSVEWSWSSGITVATQRYRDVTVLNGRDHQKLLLQPVVQIGFRRPPGAHLALFLPLGATPGPPK